MIDAGKTSAATSKAFATMAKTLAKEGAESGTLFGMTCLKAASKAFMGVFGDALVFKLGGEAHASALSLRGAKLFDPSGRGRPMKEWVVVPRAHQKKWSALAKHAFAHVSG